MARLKKHSPLTELRDIENRMEEMFSTSFPGLFKRGNGGETLRSSRWVPEVDIFRSDEGIVVECECPGMKREDIEVNLDNHTLTISGKRKREKEIDEDDYYRSERAFARFERSFRLPGDIQVEAVDATYDNGILEITLPVTESSEKKRIEVH